jgi:hypothetical protein
MICEPWRHHERAVMNPSFEIERPDHFTAGAIGPKGHRVFYL